MLKAQRKEKYIKLIIQCLAADPKNRPTFKNIRKQYIEILKEMQKFITIKYVDTKITETKLKEIENKFIMSKDDEGAKWCSNILAEMKF